MYNAPKPNLEDLPTKEQLRRSSIVAALGSVAIGVMVYLPAEYGKDPTGVGSLLGLTEMGVIKQQLATEAAADEAHQDASMFPNLWKEVAGLFVSKATAQELWKDEVTFSIEPGAWYELKATMEEGKTLFYSWEAEGGRVNFDLHAHAGSNAVTYEKGRGETSGEGFFETPFAADHGWFWRNRDSSAVTVTLRLRGDYSALVSNQ